jgi:thiol-disulfide isomerase/thioredoxin
MKPGVRLLLVALAAGGLGLLASHWYGGSPLQRSEPGQRALRAAADATAPALPPGVIAAAPGDTMPAIVLPDLDGNPVDLRASHPGRPLLINVWASWCGPCLEEMPELDRFAREQGMDGVQVIGLALDTADGVRGFLARTPVTYPLLLETPGPADASVWLGNTRGLLPYSVLVDADGRILRQKLGPFASGEIGAWTKPASAPAD